MLSLFSPAEQAQEVLLKWVGQPCRSEGGCLLTLTPKHRVSLILPIWFISITLIILASSAQSCSGALQGITPMLPGLFEFLYLCVGKNAPELKKRSRGSHTRCNRHYYKQSKINICSRVKDFHSSPINRCVLFSRALSLIPVLHQLLRHTLQKSN